MRLPLTLESIGGGAFAGCKKLRSITLPASVAIIQDGAFNGCKRLNIINIPPGCELKGRPFRDCNRLVPKGVDPAETQAVVAHVRSKVRVALLCLLVRIRSSSGLLLEGEEEGWVPPPKRARTLATEDRVLVAGVLRFLTEHEFSVRIILGYL